MFMLILFMFMFILFMFMFIKGKDLSFPSPKKKGNEAKSDIVLNEIRNETGEIYEQ